MKPNCLKQAAIVLTALGLLAAGPAWSAEAAAPEVKKVAKAKPKAKKRARVAKKPVHAKTEAVVAAAPASVAVPLPVVGPVTSGEAVATGNPYLNHAVAQAVPTANPYLSGPAVASGNPYLAASAPAAPVAVPPANTPAAPSGNSYLAASSALPVAPSAPTPAAPSGNPYLAAAPQTAAAGHGYLPAGASSFSIKDLLPSLPEGQSLLPSIKKVYPTGEKPLVVITFKCPTELIGITPVPTKLLHEGVNGVFDIVNATDLLSFNLQQVCQ